MTDQTTHMRECEARYVLKMNKVGRGNFYALVRKHRGDNAAQELIKNVKAEFEKLPKWQQRREAA